MCIGYKSIGLYCAWVYWQCKIPAIVRRLNVVRLKVNHRFFLGQRSVTAVNELDRNSSQRMWIPQGWGIAALFCFIRQTAAHAAAGANRVTRCASAALVSNKT